MLSKAKDFAFLFDFPDFSPGNGWLHRFKARHGIVVKVVVGEAASVNNEDVDAWLSDNLPTITSYAPRDVCKAGRMRTCGDASLTRSWPDLTLPGTILFLLVTTRTLRSHALTKLLCVEYEPFLTAQRPTRTMTRMLFYRRLL
ncbi:uncharacterized protein [Dermacentor albipictus]|uniref:uncharacterized protein n=1 Tax=Dermacentor albipictus TaxID=60249 RepID=UPI0031FDA9FD